MRLRRPRRGPPGRPDDRSGHGRPVAGPGPPAPRGAGRTVRPRVGGGGPIARRGPRPDPGRTARRDGESPSVAAGARRRGAARADPFGPGRRGAPPVGRTADRAGAGGSRSMMGRSRTGGGFVYLVGAGPGDPLLLTRRAAEALRGAHVVVHDRLVSPAALARAPGRAERVDVGKRPGGPQVDQQDINDLLIARARRGWVVVR